MVIRAEVGGKRVVIIRGGSKDRTVQKAILADSKAELIADSKFIIVGADGSRRHGVVIENVGEAKKQSKALRPVEKRVRKGLRRTLRSLDNYLTLHDRSNAKRKNGWLKDLGKNIRKARRKPSWA